MIDWFTNDQIADILSGTIVTIWLTILTSLTSLVVGIVAALGRSGHRRAIRRLAAWFVELFRNVPALVLLIFFAFAVPNLFDSSIRRSLFFDNFLVDAFGALTAIPVPYYGLAAIVALTANTGAHLAEIIRSGISAIPAERVEAARSLGASSFVVHRTVTVPDAVRVAFPGITNRLIHNLKNTALVGFVAVPDAFSELQAIITRTFEATQTLIFAAILYLALATMFEFGLRRVEAKLWRGRPVHRAIDV